MKILSIETSCDETSAAVIEGSRGYVRILSSIVSSQIDIHKKYGGVVPEVAARNHILNIIPVIDEALKKAEYPPAPPHVKGGKKEADEALRDAGMSRNCPQQCENKGADAGYKGADADIDLIAVTGGPGLMSSLLIGAETAETLAYAWKKPLMAVNHIEGHIYANWLEPISKFKVSAKGGSASGGQSLKDCLARPPYRREFAKGFKIKFPMLALVVSGGHAQLVVMRDHLKYKTIGQTRDDAAGEAFDKVAKILGIGYPGGPVISKMAEKHTPNPSPSHRRAQQEGKYKLPRPMIESSDFDFSFSGLKTAVLYLARDMEKIVAEARFREEVVPAICKEFQQAVIDVLVKKTIKAAKKYNAKTVLLAGGVAANKELRTQLREAVTDELGDKIIFNVPDLKLCTDNAAMVGAAAYYRYRENPKSGKIPPAGIKVDPNWAL